MRNLFLCLLLITMSIQSVSYLWIVSSFYAQKEYIIQNLCINRFKSASKCQGHCYLAKKLKENSASPEQLPESKLKEAPSFVVIESIIDLAVVAALCPPAVKIPLFDERLMLPELIFSIFHPPRQSIFS